MFRVASCTSSMAMVVASSSPCATTTQHRTIRSQIPPRPVHTVICYLDRIGSPVKNRVETNLAIVKTRQNLFYLQRVLDDGSYVRWRVPGLDRMKHATSFEAFSMHDIDEEGGVEVNKELVPWGGCTAPDYLDAIYQINRIEPIGKLTRKDRRFWHRRLFAQTEECSDKFFMYWMSRFLLGICLGAPLLQRLFCAYVNDKNFFDSDVYVKATDGDKLDAFERYVNFRDVHPEHNYKDMSLQMMSPGQDAMMASRVDLRGTDVLDAEYSSPFMWQVRHLATYGHWPKPIDSGIIDEMEAAH